MSLAKRESRSRHVDNREEFRSSRRAVLKAASIGAITITGGTLPVRRALAQQPDRAGVSVYPAHETVTASPDTEITFRGVSQNLLGTVSVEGSESGLHSGLFTPHSDDSGVSFVPDASFAEGESVTVRAGIQLRGAADGSVTFNVARPAATVKPRQHDEDDESGATPQEFRSRPDLQPLSVEVTTPATNTAEGLIFAGVKISDVQAGPMIVDNAGELVWFEPEDNVDYQVNDVRVQEYRGEQVITCFEGASPTGHGLGHYVMYNTAYERIAELSVGNGYPGGDLHECVITPEGTALVVIYHPIRWDLSAVEGQTDGVVFDGIVQELDIETGRVLFEWHSLDHIAVEESYRNISVDENTPYDYFHLNSIERDSEGNYILSARHTNAIYKFDGESGEVIWRLNGKQSDFEMGEGTPFAFQHDARVHGNGELSLFDNAESDQAKADAAWSRGLILQLNEETMTATLVQEYVHPTEILSVSQGNMQVLPNDNVFIGWGSAPVFSEHSPDGTLIFNGRFPSGANSYRAYRFPWVGQPNTPPDIAAESDSAIGLTIFASWNGATEVASWQVLVGASPDQLEPVGSAALKDGFETAISVPSDQPYVAVEALDAAGTVLGTSETIEPEA